MSSAFERLPREIRDRIYGYSLVCVGEIIPYPNIWERYEYGKSDDKTLLVGSHLSDTLGGRDKHEVRENVKYRNDLPCIALLAVSWKVHEESAIVLFGTNQWRLSQDPLGSPSTTRDIGSPMAGFWLRYAKFFRCIALRLDFRDPSPSDILESDTFNLNYRPQLRGAHLTREIHGNRTDVLMNAWNKKISFLSSNMSVTSVSLDVSNVLCPNGCCRKSMMKYCHIALMRMNSFRGIQVNDSRMFTIDYHQYPFEAGRNKRSFQVKMQGFSSNQEQEKLMRDVQPRIDTFLSSSRNQIRWNKEHKEWLSANFPELMSVIEAVE